MDLNWLLIWLTGVSCAINLTFVLRRSNSPAWGWRIILSGLLVLLAVCWQTIPQMAGYVLGPIWFLFVLAPGLLMQRVNRMLARHHYRRALWLSRLAAWLHPLDGWPRQTLLIRALALFDRGKTEQAARLIARLGNVQTSLGWTARLIQTQQSGHWQQFLEEIDRRHSPASVLHHEALLASRLQALGELGRPEEMLQLADLALDEADDLSPFSQAILQVRVAALSGQVKSTERQLTTLTQTYPADLREYWRLTARQVAGEEGVDTEFRELLKRASKLLCPMIERRLSQPLPTFDASVVSPQTAASLRKLAESIERNVQSSAWLESDLGRPWASWAIALGLIINFLREVPGGTLNPINLVKLGALIIPQSATPGEWWRVLTAGFLHFGPVHLGLNLLGLLVFAPRLERAWGRLPMLVCYVGTTFTSMALAPHVTRLTGEVPFRILVGASGGVMGLVGGLAGLMLVNWLRHRNEHTRNPLLYLLLIIALQTTFDLNTENVAFECHALGLITGLTFGTAWTWLAQKRKPNPPAP